MTPAKSDRDPLETPAYSLTDAPTDLDGGLDFTPYVQALADMATQGGTPLTIGVFGTWGSGKTSLMLMLKKQVESHKAVTGWFDAWKYDKEETLWRAFLLATLGAVRQAAQAAPQPAAPSDVDPDRLQALDHLETMLYQSIDLERVGGVTIDLSRLAGQAAKGAVQLGLSFIPAGPALAELVKTLQTKGVESLGEADLGAIRRERAKIHIEQVRFLEQFQTRFRDLVQQYVTAQGKRLVMFVDDLDRCLPEKAIEVLEAIKLFVDAPGCVFVLGVDQEVIGRGVECRYARLRRDGEAPASLPVDGARYLEKIIQLPFQLPQAAAGDMRRFVGGLVAADQWPHPACADIFSEGLGQNPRQVKRTVNVFLMLWRIAKRREEKLQGAIKPLRLAKVVALQTAAPALYAVLKEDPGLLAGLERYYRATAGLGEDRAAGKRGEPPTPEAPPALPEGLTRLADSLPAVRRIFSLRLQGVQAGDEADFGALKLDDLRLYFTLTRQVVAPAVEPAAAPALVFEPQMVLIPAGKFRMGTIPEEASQVLKEAPKDQNWKEWLKNEQPASEIDLPKYWIGKYPLKNREYQAFVRESGHPAPNGWEDDQYPPDKGDHPVVNVAWDDAQAYCQWLSQRTGKAYRLPSEAEWEEAARGQDGRVYPWGSQAPDQTRCNTENWFGGTTSAGQFSPAGDSPYGCADMAGNVWEWCQSLYKPYPYRPDDGREDLGARAARVLRGGSFINIRWRTRCAYRYGYLPGDLDNYGGFRVCLSSPTSS